MPTKFKLKFCQRYFKQLLKNTTYYFIYRSLMHINEKTGRQRGKVLYHEGVFREEVPAGYSGGPCWCVWVRSGRPSAEPTADCPNYEDSGETSDTKSVKC